MLYLHFIKYCRALSGKNGVCLLNAFAFVCKVVYVSNEAGLEIQERMFSKGFGNWSFHY